MTDIAPRRKGHFSALPKVNVHVPEMMDISSYIPTMKPPAFLKEVYTFPVQLGSQVGDHVNREVRNIGNNINKVHYKIISKEFQIKTNIFF
jgi:hypothetical protein